MFSDGRNSVAPQVSCLFDHLSAMAEPSFVNSIQKRKICTGAGS